ncbi:MAG: RsiV family protein [Muribaculaceae bacterium]|nr:RsiV family protein [Muribaculaceae bacterium]
MKLAKYLFILVPISAAAMMVGSCSRQSVYTDTTISFAELSQSSYYLLTDSFAEIESDREMMFLDSVSMVIPTLIGRNDIRPLQDSIFKTAFDTIGVDYHAVIKSYFQKAADDSGYNVIPTDKKVSLTRADGCEIVKGYVVNLSSEWFVYCVSHESMVPRAAHGMRINEYINYRINDGHIITLSDLFTEDGLAQLPELIAERADNNTSLYGPTDISALPANGNFYISADREIVFSYQPYEVASYAQGFIDVAFYPYELVGYMTPQAILMFNLSDLTSED